MKNGQGIPGVTRADRLSPEGLERLERQLQNAGRISDAVLCQWINRYGEPARALIRRHGRYHDGLEAGSRGNRGLETRGKRDPEKPGSVNCGSERARERDV